jgi:hypothetical protein
MRDPGKPGTLRRPMLAFTGAFVLVAALPLAAGAAPPQSGFKTLQPAMLAPGADAPAGTEIKAIITVGDTIGDYLFEGIPDGISFLPEGKNAARVWVNHETSTVPFGYNAAGPTTANSFNDFTNSELSELVIRKGGQILSAEKVIDTWDGFHRFCSNFLATTDGFEERPLLFTNEEGIDWVFEDVVEVNGIPTGWNNEESIEGDEGAREIGAVVAFDVGSKEHQVIWGMGRHNHENTIAVPGYGYPFLLSGDDTFVSSPAQSQVYAYVADDANAVWNDEGDLYAFVPSEADAAVNDYYDFPISSTMDISGEFILVPKEIATGKNPDGSDMMAADVPEYAEDGSYLGGPYDPPPTSGWQAGIGTGAGVDGPQWVLEHWSDLNNVFQFTRIEDMAFDKRAGMSNVVYLVDSGRGATSAGGNAFTSSNGRIWKMVLDPQDPMTVDSLSILIEGDDNPVKTLGEIHQPDNIESTVNGLLITEDPGSSQQFASADQGLPNATTARLMHYRFSDGAITAVLKVDQSADEGPTDEDAASSPGNWGAWESSGVIDVSSVFGPNKFLMTVQAGSLFVDIDTESAPDNLAPEGPDWTYKRVGGQLLLVTIPGA